MSNLLALMKSRFLISTVFHWCAGLVTLSKRTLVFNLTLCITCCWLKWFLLKESHSIFLFTTAYFKWNVNPDHRAPDYSFLCTELPTYAFSKYSWTFIFVCSVFVDSTNSRLNRFQKKSVCIEHVHFSLSLFSKWYSITTIYITFSWS